MFEKQKSLKKDGSKYFSGNKEVPKANVYELGRDLAIEGINPIDYFFRVMDRNIENDKGDFGERIILESISFENNQLLSQTKFSGAWQYVFNIISSKTGIILAINCNVQCDSYKSSIKVSEDFIKGLIQNAISGRHRTAEDFDFLYQSMLASGCKQSEEYYPYYCDICNIKFEQLYEKNSIMTLPLSPELTCRIFALRAQKYPFYMIFKELQKQNFTVTRRTVPNVLKTDKNGNKNPAMTGSLVKKKYHSDISTPLVNKRSKLLLFPRISLPDEI